MARTLFATLVGINAYPGSKNPLNGCVRDVVELNRFLTSFCQQQESLDYQPVYFLAPNPADKFLLERDLPVSYDEPTFANLSGKAFAHLKQAKRDDICLFYFSGHGSQVPAPPEFLQSKPDGMNETLVCVDSRNGARDLIDKELAYLIWDTLREKEGVHCLLIVDSCHSGNNFREESDQVKYRHESPTGESVPFSQYLGYGQNFYVQKPDGSYEPPVVRYIHLAAAAAHEKALEINGAGLFTSRLLDTLKTGGTAFSYRELMQAVQASVRNRTVNQNPVQFSRVVEDQDMTFLGTGIKPYRPTYELRYNGQHWILYGGEIDGLLSTSVVRVEGTEVRATIEEAGGNQSLLSGEGLGALEVSRAYRAYVVGRAGRKIQAGFSIALKKYPEIVAQLKSAWGETQRLYTDLLEAEGSSPGYLVRLTRDNAFVLTHANNPNYPLFKRTHDPKLFWEQVEAVGRWVSISELRQESDVFREEDFVFTWEIIEGQELDEVNLDAVRGDKETGMVSEKVLRYKGRFQPAFRLSISLHPQSRIKECFAGALYLQSKYGVMSNLIEGDDQLLVRGGPPISLGYYEGARRRSTLPITIDPDYKAWNIHEIVEYVKIVVSSRQLDLSRYEQQDLMLDNDPRGDLRSVGLERKRASAVSGLDWAVFTARVRTVK